MLSGDKYPLEMDIDKRSGDIIYHRADVDPSDPESIKQHEKIGFESFSDLDGEVKKIMNEEKDSDFV